MKHTRTFLISLFLLVTLLTGAKAYATDYISDVMVIGGTKNEMNNLKPTLQAQGWTVIDQDLNAGASGDYIYLLYKTESNTNSINWGYITDFYISNSIGTAPDTLTHNGHTYHLVSYDGGTDFINSKGDLNRGAGGDYIHLYYTSDLFTDNRTITGITFTIGNNTQSGALGVNGGTTPYDLNSGANGKYIYMHVTTSITNSPLAGLGTADSPFLIGTAADWTTFATMIEYEQYADNCYKLTANISVSTMVGTNERPFKSIFDGNGMTLTVNISGSEQGVAPFHYINGATIQNLTVGGIVTGSAYHAAGLVGFCSGGTNTITGCAVATNVIASGYGGGIVGHGLSNTLILSNSYYSGTISGFGNYAGGLLGWCDAMTLTMNNCLFKGSFSPSGGLYHPIACKNGSSTVNATVTDIYYLNCITPTATGNKTISEAEGEPVSTTYVSGEWTTLVMAADGIIYYAAPYSFTATTAIGWIEDWITPFKLEKPYSMSQQIYTPEDFDGMAGSIRSIAFRRAAFPLNNGQLVPFSLDGIQVYMKHTDKDSFNNKWDLIPCYENDKVYEGSFFAVEGSDWATITLDTAFEYNGTSNLLVCCYDPTESYLQEPNFDCFYMHDTQKIRNIYAYSIYGGPDSIPSLTGINYNNCDYLWDTYVNDAQFVISVASHFPKPTNLTVCNLSDVSANLTWEAPETLHTITGYSYQYKKASDTDWSTEISVDNTTISVALNGLSAYTEYQIRIKTIYDETESIYAYINFTTAPELPYGQGFENGLDGWIMVNFWFGIGGIKEEAKYEGEYGFYFCNAPQLTQYLISPYLGMSAIQLSFYYRDKYPNTVFWEGFQVGYSTTSNDINAFTWDEEIRFRNIPWTKYENIFPEGTRYIAIRLNSTNSWELYLDDIYIEKYSPYAKPTNLAVNNLTDQSATLTWTTPDASATSYTYQYKQLNGTWSVADTLSVTFVTLNGLTPNTEYDFRVKALYTENNASNYVSTEFMTEGETQSLPHYQDFENNMGGWRIVNGPPTTTIVSQPSVQPNTGEHCFEMIPGDSYQYLISPQFDGNSAMQFSFYYTNLISDGLSYHARFQVGYSTTTKDISNFSWGQEVVSNNYWKPYRVYSPMGAKYVAIKLTGVHRLYLDDFSIFPAHLRSVIGYGEDNGDWAFIASPVEGIIAPTDVGNLFTSTESENDLYRFNQSATAEWENCKAHSDGFLFENGKGYLYANKSDVHLVFVGIMNNDTTKTVSLDYDPQAVLKGWNLVGNPFPTAAIVNRSYYVMNEDGTGLNPQPVSAGGTIAACTGIMVKAEGPNETVTFHNYSRETTSNNGMLRIVVGNEDQAIVSFNAGDQLGKYYFGEQDANISIPQGNEEYAIVCSERQGEMPVNFKAKKNDSYTITVNPEGVEMEYLHLIDNFTGANIDLLKTPSYTFNAKNDDHASRFTLVFKAKPNRGE
jgi:hypothetical protein